MADLLRRTGLPCAVPDLRKALAEGPPFYPRLAAAAAAAANAGGGELVVVGHSAAGSLLPAVAEAVTVPVHGVFVDAQLPHPSRSWFDVAPRALRNRMLAMADDGVLPPYQEWVPGALEETLPDAHVRAEFVAELPRVPVAYFEEPAPRTRRLGRGGAYLRFTAAHDDAADKAQRRGWWVARRDWDHLSMVSQPGAVADLLLLAIRATTS